MCSSPPFPSPRPPDDATRSLAAPLVPFPLLSTPLPVLRSRFLLSSPCWGSVSSCGATRCSPSLLLSPPHGCYPVVGSPISAVFPLSPALQNRPISCNSPPLGPVSTSTVYRADSFATPVFPVVVSCSFVGLVAVPTTSVLCSVIFYTGVGVRKPSRKTEINITTFVSNH